MKKRVKAKRLQEKRMQDEQRRLNAATLELAEIGGYITQVTKLISLQYLVGSMVSVLQADIEEVFERCNVRSNKITSIQKGLDDTMDKYYDFFKGAMSKETTLDYFGDVETLEVDIKKWAGIKNMRPRRKAMKEAIPVLEAKYNVKLTETI